MSVGGSGVTNRLPGEITGTVWCPRQQEWPTLEKHRNMGLVDVWMDGYGVCCLALEAYFDLYPRRKRGEQ